MPDTTEREQMANDERLCGVSITITFPDGRKHRVDPWTFYDHRETS